DRRGGGGGHHVSHGLAHLFPGHGSHHRRRGFRRPVYGGREAGGGGQGRGTGGAPGYGGRGAPRRRGHRVPRAHRGVDGRTRPGAGIGLHVPLDHLGGPSPQVHLLRLPLGVAGDGRQPDAAEPPPAHHHDQRGAGPV